MEDFVDRIHKQVQRFAEEHGVAEASMEVELYDGAVFHVRSLSPEPGFGFVTLSPYEEDDPEAGVVTELIVPVGTLAPHHACSDRGTAPAVRLRRCPHRPEQHRRQQERHHVEPDVAARDAARRVAVGDAGAGQATLPLPGADRGPVELERRDREEHPCVGRARSASARGRGRAAARRARPPRRGGGGR